MHGRLQHTSKGQAAIEVSDADGAWGRLDPLWSLDISIWGTYGALFLIPRSATVMCGASISGISHLPIGGGTRQDPLSHRETNLA